MSLRRATTVAVTVSAAVFAVLSSVAVAAAYAALWEYRRADQASVRRMNEIAREHGLRPFHPLAVPTPTVSQAVTVAGGAAVLLAALAALALLLARGGRRWSAVAVAGVPLLLDRGQFPQVPLLWRWAPYDDVHVAAWTARVVWSVAVLAGPLTLVLLAGRRLPKPVVGTGRVLRRLLLPAVAGALVADLTTASDDTVTALIAVVVGLVACGLVATTGYRRPWVALAGAWGIVTTAGLLEQHAFDSPDGWLPGAWLPVAVLAVVGAAAAHGTLGRLWVRLLRRGPGLPARHGAIGPAAGRVGGAA